MNIRKETLTIKTFREQHLFTSQVIEFKGTEILERLFFYSYLKYFSEKNARVSITAMSLKILYLIRNLTFKKLPVDSFFSHFFY